MMFPEVTPILAASGKCAMNYIYSALFIIFIHQYHIKPHKKKSSQYRRVNILTLPDRCTDCSVISESAAILLYVIFGTLHST